MVQYNIQYNSECYKNNINIETVDLGGYPWKDNSMYYGFYQCYNLTNVVNINENVTNMQGAFANCYSLVSSPILPESIEDMRVAFGRCNNLEEMPSIPNSVVDMSGTFQLCSKITDMKIIPDSVVNMTDTFFDCSNLINITTIPNNVKYMEGTFYGCTNITNDILINSPIIENAKKCFYATNAIKNVFIPFRDENNAYTKTFNSFNVVAGYPTEEPRVNGVLLIDINDWYPSDWRFNLEENGQRRLYEYIGNNINIIVPKYKTFLNNYNSQEPQNTPFYNYSRIKFENVDLNYVPWEDNSMDRAFYNCTNLKSVSHINENVTNMHASFESCESLIDAPIIPNNVVDIIEMFSGCYNLVNAPTIPSNITNMFRTFGWCHSLVNAPVIPNGVENMDSTFISCNSLIDAPEIPDTVIDMNSTFQDCFNLSSITKISNSVVDMTDTFRFCFNLSSVPSIPDSVEFLVNTFDGCSKLTGDIFIHSKNVYNALNCFVNTSLDKNVYIHFQDNGEYTSTYNAFINAGYSDVNRVHGVLLVDIDGFDIDLSDYQWDYEGTEFAKDVTLYKYIGTGKKIIVTPHLS